jgi:hypothetical protein
MAAAKTSTQAPVDARSRPADTNPEHGDSDHWIILAAMTSASYLRALLLPTDPKVLRTDELVGQRAQIYFHSITPLERQTQAAAESGKLFRDGP